MKTRLINIPMTGYLAIMMLLASCTHPKTAKQKEWIDPMKETVEQRDARMAWWREARFGLFIHWGV